MNDFRQQLKPMTPASSALLENIQKTQAEANEIAQKEFKIRKHRADLLSKEIDDGIAAVEAVKKIRLDIIDPQYVKDLIEENTSYFDSAQNAADFLNADFRQMVPYFARNLIFIGAESGNGKSTIAGNLAYSTVMQGKNTLLITNEEIDSDVYNRVTCLYKNWGYTDHRQFTGEQIKTMNSMYEIWLPKLTVVSDKFQGAGGTTTTFEGIRSILESLFTIKKKYDVIIIDYFQNISMSIEDHNTPEYKVLDRLTKYLDTYRKKYDAPVVVLGQVKMRNPDDSTPFKERIERCKAIYNVATCCLEVRADRDNSRTEFICHKSRFNKGVGEKILVGFDKGRYVLHDVDFANRLLLRQDRESTVKMLEGVMKVKA